MTDDIGNTIDLRDVSKTYNILRHSKITEIRLIEANVEKPKVESRFVINQKDFIKVICKFSGSKYNVYVGINERHEQGTKDEDVVAVSTCCLDIDPIRPKNTSSNEVQLEEAKKVAEMISYHIISKDFKKPSVAMSGNGFQVWFRLQPIPITEQNMEEIKSKLKAFEKEIRDKFETESIRMDSMHNLSRIMKVIGTLSVKGDMHRLSKWIYYNEEGDDEKLTNYILSLPTEKIEIPKNNIIIEDEDIKKIIDNDQKIKQLYNGNYDGYKTRSEAEQALVCRLLFKGIIDYGSIDSIMCLCKIGKWEKSKPEYREITYRKALELYNNNLNNDKSKKTDKNKDDILQLSFYEDSNYLYEQVFDGKKASFARWDGKKVDYVDSFDLDNGMKVVPIFNDAILEGAVQLPSKAEEYLSVEQLTSIIIDYLHKYLDFSLDFEKIIAPFYILLSWIYDRLNTVPYLRSLGDTGSGKSRFLDVVGGLCYKACFVSGCITPAPIYRMIKMWRGTIILDEADFRESSEKNEVVKILNCGFEKNRPVIRCDSNNPEKILFLPTYCPKVIGSRFTFDDKALESRCLTEKMAETTREDIPTTLPKEFYDERLKLCNQLLMYRFKTRKSVNPEVIQSFDFGSIEPRLKQAMSSFIVLLNNFPSLQEQFKTFIFKYNEELIDERSTTFEGKIIDIIFDLKGNGQNKISSIDISNAMETRYNLNGVSTQSVGKYLKSLKIQTKQDRVDGKVRRVIVWDERHMGIVKKRYMPNATNDTVDTVVEEVVANVASVAYEASQAIDSEDGTIKTQHGTFKTSIARILLPCKNCNEMPNNGCKFENSVTGAPYCNVCAGIPDKQK